MKLATTIAGLTLAIAAAYSTPVIAQTVHINASQPMARCLGSTAEFASRLWARPLAIQNTSNQATWLTCGFEFDTGEAIAGSAEMIDVYFTNHSAVEATVTCAGVTGWQGGETENVSLSVVIPASDEDGDGEGNLWWEAAEFEGGGMQTGLVAINCRLPAGVSINDSYVYWASEDTTVD